MDLKDQGDLIFRNQFTVQKGKEAEYKAMVFLFEKIMLFTEIKLEVWTKTKNGNKNINSMMFKTIAKFSE